MSPCNKNFFKKAFLIIGLAVFFQASLARPFDDGRQGIEKGGPELGYVLGVLRENRTGLGSTEELKLARVILGESRAYDLDPLFVLAMIKTESTFYNWSKSLNGAVGLMQILPSTGRELATEMDLDWKGEETLLDPYLNVKIGIRYLSGLKERFSDLSSLIAAYNAGPGHIASRLRDGEAVAKNYVNKVLYTYRDLKEKAYYY